MFLSRHKVAPGPPKLPLLGNVHHVGLKRQWETFAKWSQTYNSDIVQAEGFGLYLLILNSHQSASDLLDARLAIYSSRPNIPLSNDLKKILEPLFIFTPFGERWKKTRQMVTNHLDVKATERIHSEELQALYTYLDMLLESPQDFVTHTEEFFRVTSLSTLYGINTPDAMTEVSCAFNKVRTYAPRVFSIGSLLSILAPSAIKKVLPNLSTPKAVTAIQESVVSLKDTPFNESHAAWRAGPYRPSMVSNALRASQIPEPDLRILSEAAGTSLFAFNALGVPTFMVFFLAMTLHPNAQKAAQQELDEVLGGRLPTHADLSALPYITAIFREVLRWLPVLPLGIIHLVTEDDYYRDCFIRKNTLVVANQWAIFRDENQYPDAATFKPERFLKDGQLNPDVLDPCKVAFGRGGRVCPGQDLAESTLKIAMASILATFDIQKALDDNGNVIEPDVPYCEHGHFDPPAFPCKITPRSAQAAQIIRDRSSTCSNDI